MRVVGTAVAFVAFATATVHAAPELVVTASPQPGIIRERWREPTIPAEVHVVQIDLTSAQLTLVATPEGMRGRTTSSFAASQTATVTINGGPFAAAGYTPYGLAVGSRMAWSNAGLDDTATAVFHFKRGALGNGERTIAGIITPEAVTTLADLPVDTDGVISGRPLLIRAAAVEANPDCADPVTIACQRAPRTALAMSEDGNTLWLVVVDGWQAGSLGMTAAELGRFLRDTKAPHTAMALDSGGSSTLVINNALLSDPSDGVERPVANHLAVQFEPKNSGNLTGDICHEDVIACRDNPSLLLPGAEVTLDDGRVQVVGSTARYNFSGISPRLACVTVRLAGYLTKTACDYVPAGGIGFESVAMFEGDDPPDAGPRDAGPDPGPDPMDAGLRPDAGQPAIGEGGGCCDSGKSPSGVPDLLRCVGVGLVAFMLLRRRGTTAVR